jgi:hypothetical protein
MQQANSEHAINPLEDQWAGVLNTYQNHPVKALILAQNFQAIKDILETGPQGTVQVIQSMDEAIDTLFPFSEIYQAGREFFLLAVKGTLPPAFDLTKLAAQARSDAASP